MKINDQIIVIDPLTDKIIKRIEMGADLHLSHVALTSDSNYAIAAAQTKGVIYKINTRTYEVEKEAITEKGGEPHGLRISPDGKTAYIAMLKGKSIGVLDIEKMSLSYIPLKGGGGADGSNGGWKIRFGFRLRCEELGGLRYYFPKIKLCGFAQKMPKGRCKYIRRPIPNMSMWLTKDITSISQIAIWSTKLV